MTEDVRILFVDFVGLEKTVKVMSYAKGIASTVKNPISNAISKLDDRIETANVKKLKEFHDFGVWGKIDNDEILLGNEKVMRERNIMLKGDTSNKIFLAINNQVQAVFKIG